MLRRNIYLLLFILLLPTLVVGQIEHPNKAYGIVSVQVIEEEDDYYVYQYTVTNSKLSEQFLVSFTLQVSDSISSDRIIVLSEEKKWYISYDTQGYIAGSAASRFLDIPGENLLARDESIDFSFPSRGLPALMPFYTRGFMKPFTMQMLDSLYEAGYTDKEIFLDWREESYQGITISPRVWPDDINLMNFLDTLINYKDEAFELGWITDNGVKNALNQQLYNARRHLERGNVTPTRNMLNAFLNLVEAQKDKHITSEGYALLRYNAEYLIERLK